MLDIEYITFLNRLSLSPHRCPGWYLRRIAVEAPYAVPRIISTHGIPADLLDRWGCPTGPFITYWYVVPWARCLIVRMDSEAYTCEQVGNVVQLRAAVEGLQLGPGVLEKLAAEGERNSLSLIFLLLCIQFHLAIILDMHYNYLRQHPSRYWRNWLTENRSKWTMLTKWTIQADEKISISPCIGRHVYLTAPPHRTCWRWNGEPQLTLLMYRYLEI